MNYGKILQLMEEKYFSFQPEGSYDDFINHLEQSYIQTKEDIKNKCNTTYVTAKDVFKAANTALKNNKHISAQKLKVFSSSEIAKRKKVHEKAVGTFAELIAHNKMNETYYNQTPAARKRFSRQTHQLLINCCESIDEMDEVIGWLREPGQYDINNRLNRDKTKDFVEYNIQKSLYCLDYLMQKHPDDEYLDFVQQNAGIIMLMQEFQGDSIDQIESDLNIHINPDLKREFGKYKSQLVELGTNARIDIGNMANPLYPEIAVEDVNLINEIISPEYDDQLTNDQVDSALKVRAGTANKEIINPFEQYAANTVIQESMKLTSFLKDKDVYDFANSPLGNHTQEHHDRLVEEKRNKPLNFVRIEKNISDSLSYNLNKYFGTEAVSYRLNGEEIGVKEAIHKAATGEYIQIFDGNNENFLMNLRVEKGDYRGIISLADPVSFDFRGIVENAENSDPEDFPNKEFPDIKTELKVTSDNLIKNNIKELLTGLDKNSRFWISSKGEYGQVRNALKDILKSDLTNRDTLADKFKNVRDIANKYLTTRANKTDRSQLALDREFAVERVFQSLLGIENNLGYLKDQQCYYMDKAEVEALYPPKAEKPEVDIENLNIDPDEVSLESDLRSEFSNDDIIIKVQNNDLKK